MAVNPNLNVGEPFDMGQFSQDLRSISSPVQPDDELLNTLVTNIAGASKDAGLSTLNKFKGPRYWLKDRLAIANRGRLTRDDLTNGLGVDDEVEHAKFNAVAQQIEKDLPQLQQMRQENIQAYMDSVRGILSHAPSHPAIAALAKPNKDQIGMAIALALIAPKASSNIAMSLAQNQIGQQQQQQHINDLDFEAQLHQIDQNIGLTTEAFKAQDKAISDEIQNNLYQKTEGEKLEIDKIKADNNKTETLRRVLSDVSTTVNQIGDTSPATVEALVRQRNDLFGLGLSEAEITAIVKDVSTSTERKARADEANILKTQAQTALTGQQTLTEEQETIKKTNDNKFFNDSYQSRLTEIEDRAKGYGLDNSFKELRNKKLEIELPYVKQEVLADIAHTEASTEYLRQLKNASVAGNSKVNKSLDLEIDFAEDDLKAAEKKWADLDKAAQDAEAGYKAAESAMQQGLTDESGNPLVTKEKLEVLLKRMHQMGLAAIRQKKAIEDQRNVIRGLKVREREVQDVAAANPLEIDPSLKGKIGG